MQAYRLRGKGALSLEWLFKKEVLLFAVTFLVITTIWDLLAGEAFDVAFVFSQLLTAVVAWLVYAFIVYLSRRNRGEK